MPDKEVMSREDSKSSRSPAGYDANLVKDLRQRVIEQTIEIGQLKEAIVNYMSMGVIGDDDELVEEFIKTHLPDEPFESELVEEEDE